MDPCLIAAFDSGTIVAILKAAFGLGLVIFVHELGHFLVAKACGVKCEKFYVGFDAPIKIGPISLPSALIKKQWGETEYGVGIIPLGGYVKMLGQDDNPANAAREAERIRLANQTTDDNQDAEWSAPVNDVRADEGEGQEDVGELDPRSYPAKSVPQRMAIISAGVVMNLIFAVVFAAVAYRIGVSYEPCTVSAAVAGDPAWRAGLRPGDKVIQMGKDGRLDEQLRFLKDLKLKVFSVGAGNDLHLFVRHRDGTEEWVKLKPNTPYKEETGFPTIGVMSGRTNRVHKSIPVQKYSAAADAEPHFKGGETIAAIEVDGRRLNTDGALEIEAALARFPSHEMTFIVESSANDGTSTSESILVKPKRGRELGLIMTMGKVTAIAANSPAATAGVRENDVLLKVNGQKIDDPMLLEQQLLNLVGTPVALDVQRDDAIQTLTIIPREPRFFLSAHRPHAPAACETLGIAYEVGLRIHGVRDGTPASGQLAAGDELTGIEFLLSDDVKDPEIRLPTVKPGEFGWPWAQSQIQYLPVDTLVQLSFRRGQEERSIVLEPIDTDEWFFPERGINLSPQTEIRQSNKLGEAITLGVRETKEGIMQVLLVLRRIGDSYKNLGGPGSIAAVATMEAKEGIPRLLVFLTLLSANLAVINFLPIPVLDGGHMMFLLYEGVSGKPVNERLAFGLTLLGFGFIICLMLFVIGLDVNRFVFG